MGFKPQNWSGWSPTFSQAPTARWTALNKMGHYTDRKKIRAPMGRHGLPVWNCQTILAAVLQTRQKWDPVVDWCAMINFCLWELQGGRHHVVIRPKLSSLPNVDSHLTLQGQPSNLPTGLMDHVAYPGASCSVILLLQEVEHVDLNSSSV